MKKILTIFGVMLIILFALTINVHAYTYSVNLQPAKTKLKAGETVNIDIMINSLALEENEAGLIGFEAGLDYDNTVFSKASVSGNGQWSEGENITKVKGIFFSNEVKEPGKLATLTLTVAEDAEVGEEIITLKNIKTANGTSDEITTNDVSVKFTIVEDDNDNLNDDTNEDENDDVNDGTNEDENKNDDANDDINKDENENDNVNDDTNKDEDKNDNLNNDTNKDENKNNNTANKNNGTNKNNTVNKNNTTKDNTIANKVISAAGLENISALVVGALVVIAGVSYMSYKKYKNM